MGNCEKRTTRFHNSLQNSRSVRDFPSQRTACQLNSHDNVPRYFFQVEQHPDFVAYAAVRQPEEPPACVLPSIGSLRPLQLDSPPSYRLASVRSIAPSRYTPSPPSLQSSPVRLRNPRLDAAADCPPPSRRTRSHSISPFGRTCCGVVLGQSGARSEVWKGPAGPDEPARAPDSERKTVRVAVGRNP